MKSLNLTRNFFWLKPCLLVISMVVSSLSQGQSGKAFRDFNGDGVQTGAEPGVEGTIVRLFSNGAFPNKDVLVGVAYTNASGIYNFATNIDAGRPANTGEKLRLEFDIPATFNCGLED